MGQFLTTAITTSFRVGDKTLQQISDNEAEAKRKLLDAFVGTNDDIFDITKKDDTHIFSIKEDILKKEWLSFLTQFYRDFYGESHAESQIVLEALGELDTPKKYIELAGKSEYECYQQDRYAGEYIYIDNQRISIGYEPIMLTLEGKIMMECYGEHFTFLEKMISKVYPQFQLANMVKVYISG